MPHMFYSTIIYIYIYAKRSFQRTKCASNGNTQLDTPWKTDQVPAWNGNITQNGAVFSCTILQQDTKADQNTTANRLFNFWFFFFYNSHRQQKRENIPNSNNGCKRKSEAYSRERNSTDESSAIREWRTNGNRKMSTGLYYTYGYARRNSRPIFPCYKNIFFSALILNWKKASTGNGEDRNVTVENVCFENRPRVRARGWHWQPCTVVNGQKKKSNQNFFFCFHNFFLLVTIP